MCFADHFEFYFVDVREFRFCCLHAFHACFVEFETLLEGALDFVVHRVFPCGGLPRFPSMEFPMSVKKIFVRDGMSYDTALYDAGVDCRVDPDTGEELTTMTKQSFKDDCDINNIMRKYERTGVLDHTAMSVPQYGEYMGSMSYQDSLNAILYAQDQFAALPADLRARFGNDPAELLSFMEDSANLDEAVKLGLVQKPIVPQPLSVVADTPPAERPAKTAPKPSKTAPVADDAA
ncbi:internal scaffolding protein [Blackfly microvirus SF02]|uniref:Internal scaffolding protein n=1 Tax=Blackfly microvirus SF02 TaxID=2576452 RepID=A0A4P8PSV0_9VIRU|nr:internal scaffolding protein [Blackfly microvirus SF02]